MIIKRKIIVEFEECILNKIITEPFYMCTIDGKLWYAVQRRIPDKEINDYRPRGKMKFQRGILLYIY